MTTFLNYGAVAVPRQGEIIGALAQSQHTPSSSMDELAEILLRKMRDSVTEKADK